MFKCISKKIMALLLLLSRQKHFSTGGSFNWLAFFMFFCVYQVIFIKPSSLIFYTQKFSCPNIKLFPLHYSFLEFFSRSQLFQTHVLYRIPSSWIEMFSDKKTERYCTNLLNLVTVLYKNIINIINILTIIAFS